jgi:TolA-binding protein
LVFAISSSATAFGSTSDLSNKDDSISPPPVIETSRELYNAGTQKLRAGKLTEAESLLQASVSKQNENVQPAALYNLGQVRFAQGNEELKKQPSASATAGRGRAAANSGANAIQQAESALAGDDVQKMVEAYIAGRGVRKEIRAATEAVRRAMEAHGKTLLKWRRSLGDFKSAAELNPADTNAVRNAEVVERAIAKLVDSLREMQQMEKNLGNSQGKLNQLLQQLKGKIPAPMAPPGGAGDEDEDVPLDSLQGLKEAPTSGGKEMELNLSREEAGELLNGILPDGKLLPMGQGETGKPKDRPRKTW